jgi:predicted XRE-type DNA-binding protein
MARKAKTVKAGSRGEIDGVAFEVGSGNVFADLGLPDAQERQTKARLASRIAALLSGRTQQEAATALGLDQPKVSKLVRGQLRGFSVERLLHLLTILGQDVEIRVSPATRSRTTRPKPGRIVVAS